MDEICCIELRSDREVHDWPGVHILNAQKVRKAFQIGLRDDDVLLGVNGRYVNSPQDVRNAIREANRFVVFNLVRGDSRIDLRARKGSTQGT